MPVAVASRTSRATAWGSHVRTRGRAILRALALSRAELSIALVDDDEMRALNRTYRHQDRPTDVLAFSLEGAEPHGPDGSPAGDQDAAAPATRLLGDVVISIDTARAQARELRTSLPRRLDTLLVHGVLHLLGYDHERSTWEARRMARAARALQAALEPRRRRARHR